MRRADQPTLFVPDDRTTLTGLNVVCHGGHDRQRNRYDGKEEAASNGYPAAAWPLPA
jgi:hypothetical protein